ncbi:Hairy/enhancer-of-split with YRPW motif protein 2 [Knufia peltigerae]|uniref:Sugar phosphate phosphatase n=1 Tax=Knufia peltigerae TaxID=1002370 RepID=A0AA39D223_9EURO|nr:Hairy/enhancer-of-split with YRPW motif protein 2 [Knufia peltigerae]
MDLDPPIPKYQTSDPTSFAYKSARERWPAIITGAIDDVTRSVSALPGDAEDAVAEGKRIISSLGSLKYELQHDRALVEIGDDGQADVGLYNDELAARGRESGGGVVKWHGVEWLYGECYLYRRIGVLFSTARTAAWKGYDPFARQKMDTFRSSRNAVLELATRYREIIAQIKGSEDHRHLLAAGDESDEAEAEKTLFVEMAEICLWGNATDLSLLTTLTYEDIQKLQGSQARRESEKNVIVNDLGKAFDVLKRAEREGHQNRRVDIVLDNAGFELFVDLVLAGYLIAVGLATEVVLHPKSMPWFVSDVVPGDFAALLDAMRDPATFYASSETESKGLTEQQESDIKFLFEDWKNLHEDGKLILRPNRFWTHAGSFWRMPKIAPEVLEDLRESELVVFKGDLNYRKLTGDATWQPTTPFTDAIGPLGPGSGLRVLALRTCKADVVVGLPNGKDEEIRAMEGGGGDSGARKWAWSGKWAVVQFSDGKGTT